MNRKCFFTLLIFLAFSHSMSASHDVKIGRTIGRAGARLMGFGVKSALFSVGSFMAADIAGNSLEKHKNWYKDHHIVKGLVEGVNAGGTIISIPALWLACTSFGLGFNVWCVHWFFRIAGA